MSFDLLNSKLSPKILIKSIDSPSSSTQTTNGDPLEESPETSTARRSGGHYVVKPQEDSFHGKVESKLLTMWNNVKFGLGGKIKPNFSKDHPVWLLGRCYHRKLTPYSSMESSAEMNTHLENKLHMNVNSDVQEFGTDVIESSWEEDGIEGCRKDFFSRLWMTYRREFPTMNGYTTDCGWGCMLRSGQMMLAQALVCHFLSREWRYDPDTQIHSTHEDTWHRKIIRWFGDSKSKNSPFSIHTLVNLSSLSGKKPGDWYGPGSVSHLLKEAVKQASQEIYDLEGITICVAQDSTVYIQDILDECCLVPEESTAPWNRAKKSNEFNKNSENPSWKSLVLLVPLRLGTDKLNSAYANNLTTLLSTEYCIGFIGGRPKHSLYFVGYQDDKLIHLDPHYCQEMVDVNQEKFDFQSFHCKNLRKMKVSKMDPCCCIGFYCKTRNDFDRFIESVQEVIITIFYLKFKNDINLSINYRFSTYCP